MLQSGGPSLGMSTLLVQDDGGWHVGEVFVLEDTEKAHVWQCNGMQGEILGEGANQ